jgi:hypothetical protein
LPVRGYGMAGEGRVNGFRQAISLLDPEFDVELFALPMWTELRIYHISIISLEAAQQIFQLEYLREMMKLL